MLSTYAGRAADMKVWLANAEINRDRSLRLQYLAGLHLNSTKGADAYAEMVGYRKFPDDIFIGKSPLRQALWVTLTSGTSH